MFVSVNCFPFTVRSHIINNNFTFQISKTYSDPEGRFIICDPPGFLERKKKQQQSRIFLGVIFLCLHKRG